MPLDEVIYNVLTNDEANQAYQEDPQGYLEEQGYGDATSEDVEAAMPNVFEQINDSGVGQVNAGGVAQVDGGDANLEQNASTGGAEGDYEYPEGVDGAIEAINQYATQVNVNETHVSDDDATFVEARESSGLDQSSNDDILAGGDVYEESDNDAAVGEDSIASGDYSQNNTGDEAIQTGGDVYDSTQATGDVGGSVTGDNYGSTVGDGNFQAENANMGDGTQVSDVGGDANTNSGDGSLTSVSDSYVSESSVGEGAGDVFSDDPNVSAYDGSSVAFGEGSTSSAEETNTAVIGNTGTTQVADDGTQEGYTDFSTNDSGNTTDSFNSAFDATDNSTNDSYNQYDSNNLDESYEDNSWNTSSEDSSSDDDSWTDNSVQDNDGYDVDAHGYGESYESGTEGYEATPEPEPEPIDPGFGS